MSLSSLSYCGFLPSECGGALLRFTSPVNHANDRFTTEDVPLGDVVIPAGEWVLGLEQQRNSQWR